MGSRTGAGRTAGGPAALFGAEIRHARELAGYSQADLARLLHCDRSLITRIESGQRVPQEDFAAACDRVLRTDGLLARIWSRVDWYAQAEHPDWFRRFAEMEAAAVALRKYEAQLVPGLLQTEAYARALFARGARGSGDALVEERVAARLGPQRRFLAEDGPLLVVVLDEGALRRSVGGPEVMHSQLAHLLAVAARPNVALQVLPFAHHDAARPDTSMSLVTLPDGREWVYSESLDRGHFSNDPAVLARHARTYDLLRSDALSARGTGTLIARAMEGYDHDQSRSGHGRMAQEPAQRIERRRLRRGGPRLPRRRPGA
ncbi:Scr1 family TA system antitoxin-like transcriptional regulator [Kitasatospora sp. NPDC059571]|uniref:helix-turn-helix domain-containing protein n=1 Tax=Kitasatospora sp. NPDC059571 TaxID=3346871 RepID=UPI0036CA7752